MGRGRRGDAAATTAASAAALVGVHEREVKADASIARLWHHLPHEVAELLQSGVSPSVDLHLPGGAAVAPATGASEVLSLVLCTHLLPQ
jgi:hypothetical protein